MEKIGIVLPKNISISAYQAGNIMENELNAMGYETFVKYGTDIQEQIQQIEVMINMGCNLLICWALDSEAVQAVFNEAKEQGIEIISFARLVKNTDAISCYVSFDYCNAGILQGEYLRDKLDLDNMSDIRIALFTPEADDWQWKQLFSGVMEILQVYFDDGKLTGEINYISDFNSEIAKRRMQELIEEAGYDPYNLVYTAIYCSIDSYASGVIEALTEAGFDASNMPLITGFGGDTQAMENVINGLQSITISEDFVEAGETTAKIANALLQGEDIESQFINEYLDNGSISVPSCLCGVKMYDQTNAVMPPNRILMSITLDRPPDKTEYYEGEMFDSTGMVVTAHYTGGASEDITSSILTHSYKLEAGMKSITIYHTEYGVQKSVMIPIIVHKDYPNTIVIVKQPNKTNYFEGEFFEPTGMEVEAVYMSGKKENIDDYTLQPEGPLTVADKEITVSYQYDGKIYTTTIPIHVTERVLILPPRSKIHQSKLTYACNSGEAYVNIYTGEAEVICPDISIGVNGYEIGVAHVYNEEGFLFPKNRDACVGKHWKLNIQQYLWLEKENYIYIDNRGDCHEFEPLGDGRYYDTSGSGLILNAEGTIISDQLGNKMYFSNNVLVKTESCHNSTAVKHYVYTEGKLTSVYDGRTPENKIDFVYDSESGLLTSLICRKGGTEKQTYRYYYDDIENLIRTEKAVGTEVKNLTLFRYESITGGENNEKLTYMVNMQDKSALRFDYEYEAAAEKKYSVTKVSTGTAEYTPVYENGSQTATRYTVKDGVETLGTDMKSKNTFRYNIEREGRNYTSVKNEKGIEVIYYFNTDGITTSILEANEGNIKDLRTLEKQSGIYIFGEGTDTEKINTRKVFVMTKKEISSKDDSALSERFTDAKTYRQAKCPDYKYYTLSFWLKILERGEEKPEIKVTINSKNAESADTDESVGVYDEQALDSWQLIALPVKITLEEIEEIKLYIEGTSRYKIANMYLKYAPNMNLFVGNRDGANIALKDIGYIDYLSPGQTAYMAREIDKEFYITDKDLQAIYLSRYGGKNDMILSFCDNTKKLKINDMIFWNKTRSEGFLFGLDENGRAQFYQEMKSPDGEIVTYGELYFGKDIDGNTFSGICQKVTAQKGEKESTEYKLLDYKGKLIKEKDEYEVETVYEYDTYGNVTKKILQHPDTSEKLVFEQTLGFNEKTETGSVDYTKIKYDDFFGNVESMNYRGKNESEENMLSIQYGYNVFEDQLESLENNLGEKGSLKYDESGKLSGALTLTENAGGYGYKFGYDHFGGIKNTYLTNGTEITERLLSAHETDYATGTMTAKVYRTDTVNADETVVELDKYGRTSEIRERNTGESSKTTTFKRQELYESKGAAEVEEMYDPYEDRTYNYSYEDENGCTGYTINNGGGIFQKIEKTGETEITYEFSGIESDFKTRITYEDKLLSPRIKETLLTNLSDMLAFNAKAEYTYDEFGRKIYKNNWFSNKIGAITAVKENDEYKEGTVLKSKRITYVEDGLQSGEVSDGQIKKLGGYENEYTYNDRGQLKEDTNFRIDIVEYIEQKDEQYKKEYTYDKANRLETETSIQNNYSHTVIYEYNPDGSIAREYVENRSAFDYFYENGRLTSYVQSVGNDCVTYDYDNFGNCIGYGPSGKARTVNMEWERGNLLKSYTDNTSESSGKTEYYYNNQGIRFKKKIGNTETVYYLDGGKILAEKRGEEWISYIYDQEGLAGFQLNDGNIYYYLKDGQGNVISIFGRHQEEARYEYDAWGRCTITKDINGIGKLNPIRWKSRYYDEESGMYYIGGRYYNPIIKRYMNPANPESSMGGAAQLYGLNLYLLTLTNPVEMVYNGYTIEPNGELVYDAPQLSESDLFWQSKFGKWLGAGIFFATTMAAIFLPGFRELYIGTAIGVTVSLGVGGIIAGYRSQKEGNGFWDGFTEYINENWAQTVVISFTIALISFGISQAVAAIRATSAKTVIPNQLNPESYAKAIEGNPSFNTFRKRYWKAEALRAPELYGNNVEKMLKGRAPVINGEKLVLHHVAGRLNGNIYNVVVLPQSQHIAFHKTYGYKDPSLWPNLWG